MFWLDDSEPNVRHDGLVYACGPSAYCGALWPNRWAAIFADGARSAGVPSPVMLSRAAWAGFQTTGATLWSSDIPSSFESLRVQVRAGLSTMMSGLPWWTTDIGGFSGGDITSPEWRELAVRWYQYGAFCPVFRTHGDRAGHAPPLPPSGERWHEPAAQCTAPGGHASGASNEIWDFGDEAYGIIRGVIALRESLRGYVAALGRNASESGAPPMRPLWYDFPDDAAAWRVEDAFMFGPAFLVAPVLELGARSRAVYFPGGEAATWRHHYTQQVYRGGSNVTVAAPLSHFPLFTRA